MCMLTAAVASNCRVYEFLNCTNLRPVTLTIKIKLSTDPKYAFSRYISGKKVQVGKDQEMAQSEKDSHSKSN